jgi:hypothetical protein
MAAARVTSALRHPRTIAAGSSFVLAGLAWLKWGEQALCKRRMRAALLGDPQVSALPSPDLRVRVPQTPLLEVLKTQPGARRID